MDFKCFPSKLLKLETVWVWRIYLLQAEKRVTFNDSFVYLSGATGAGIELNVAGV